MKMRKAKCEMRNGRVSSAHPFHISTFAFRILVLGFAISCGSPEPARYQSVSEKIIVIIPRGATYYEALDSLVARGVITNRDWFSL